MSSKTSQPSAYSSSWVMQRSHTKIFIPIKWITIMSGPYKCHRTSSKQACLHWKKSNNTLECTITTKSMLSNECRRALQNLSVYNLRSIKLLDFRYSHSDALMLDLWMLCLTLDQIWTDEYRLNSPWADVQTTSVSLYLTGNVFDNKDWIFKPCNTFPIAVFINGQ